MLKKTIALLGLSLAALSANAAIQDLGTITRDTETGLEWLDVTETAGMTYNQVITATETGALQGQGWEYATADQFDELIINFGYIAVTTGCFFGTTHCDIPATEQQEVIRNIITTLGDTLDNIMTRQPIRQTSPLVARDTPWGCSANFCLTPHPRSS